MYVIPRQVQSCTSLLFSSIPYEGENAKGAVTAEILIGTSGYSYHEWVGPVYPAGTKQKDYLSTYAGMFPTVELNFPYYRMPKAQKYGTDA